MTFSFAQVERGIGEAIRLECVRLGYLPDRTLYVTTATYEAAKAVIRATGKKIIEVYGIGDIKARDEMNYNSIIINRDDITPGTMGMVGTLSYVPRIVNPGSSEKTVYDTYNNQSGTFNIQYQISYITDDVFYDRLIQNIIINSLQMRGYVLGVNDDGTMMTRGFNTIYRTTLDKSGSDFIERAIRYDCIDIALGDPKFTYTASQILEINIEPVPVATDEEAQEEIS